MRAWLFDASCTVVTQSTKPHFTPRCVAFLTTTVETEIQKRWIQRGKKVNYVHDWRSVESYDAATHAPVVAWGSASVKHAKHVVVSISPTASIFVRIAVTTGVGLLRVAGMPIEAVAELDDVMRALGP